MKKVLPLAIAGIIVIAGLAFYFASKKSNDSYSSSTGSSTDNRMPNMPDQMQNNMSKNPQSTDKVAIVNFAFSPAAITVKKGTTVTWTNQDSAAHTVVETDGQAGPKSDNLAQGQSYSFTFNEVGTFKYHCSIHPGMTGSVTVTE